MQNARDRVSANTRPVPESTSFVSLPTSVAVIRNYCLRNVGYLQGAVGFILAALEMGKMAFIARFHVYRHLFKVYSGKVLETYGSLSDKFEAFFSQ